MSDDLRITETMQENAEHFGDVVTRVAKALMQHAPHVYDPASDDMTVEFAIQLADKDEKIEQQARRIARWEMAYGELLEEREIKNDQLAALRAMPLQDHADLAADNDRLSEALKSQTAQTWKESDRADKADHMRVAIETGKVHPALAIDVSEHRQQAYQTGWNDGYAEGFGKAKSDAKP